MALLNEDEMFAHGELQFDLHNPRSPDDAYESEEAAIAYLIEFADVHELVQSILNAGWLDYEPLIVERATKVVFEGNRRLAALRLISDPALRARLQYNLPAGNDQKALPEKVRIRWVDTRADARAYIGFKHINGPFKWDALAKAKFAAEWLRDSSGALEQVSRTLGDNHNTVRRLVNGWILLDQAKKEGFRPDQTTRRGFPFSHLYTALARPNVRQFLGLPDDSDGGVLPADPVPNEKKPQLRELMSWLYGQRDEPAIIRTQNPDLNRLVDVIGSSMALESLRASRSIDKAYELIEDKGQKFTQALLAAVKNVEEAAGLVGSFDGDGSTLKACESLLKSVRLLRDSMRRVVDGEDRDEARDGG